MSLKGYVRRKIRKVKRAASLLGVNNRYHKAAAKVNDTSRTEKGLEQAKKSEKYKNKNDSEKQAFDESFRENGRKAREKFDRKGTIIATSDLHSIQKGAKNTKKVIEGGVIAGGATYAYKKYKEKKAKEAAAAKQAAYDKTFKGKVEKSYKKVKSKFKGKDKK